MNRQAKEFRAVRSKLKEDFHNIFLDVKHLFANVVNFSDPVETILVEPRIAFQFLHDRCTSTLDILSSSEIIIIKLIS